MILRNTANTPVTAPQVTAKNAVWAKLQQWKNDPGLTEDELYAFLCLPSAERTQFLATLSAVHTPGEGFITQTFS